MNGGTNRERRVSAPDIKPFHARFHNLGNSIGDESGVQAWDPDLGLAKSPEDAAPLNTNLDRRLTSSKGATKWEYSGWQLEHDSYHDSYHTCITVTRNGGQEYVH